MRFFVTSIFLYTCESWSLTGELQRRTQAMENEVLPQDITHLIQRPCYQRGSPCQDEAGNRKEMQTAVVWTHLRFIRCGQNHLARHSETGKMTRQTEEEVGRQHQGMDRPGVRQVPEGSGEQGKMEKTGCKIIRGAPTTLVVKRLMMMMMMTQRSITVHSHHPASPFSWRYSRSPFRIGTLLNTYCHAHSFHSSVTKNSQTVHKQCH